MKTVLTGASGFVGSNIAKVLTDRHGDEVVAFVHELIGRRIIDQDGTDHGPVTAVVDNPASDLLELGDGRLVPLTFYRGSDPEAGTIIVDVPAGLLDPD